MDSVTFLGLSGAEWSFINSFANWVAAIGTVSAVIVSLYLALNTSRPKAKLSIDIRNIIDLEHNGDYPEIVSIKMVNTGERLIHITNLGWKLGVFNKRYAVQVINGTRFSQGIPVSLEYGNEANWHILVHAKGDWYKYFSQGFLKRAGRWRIRSLRIVALTSTGHKFSAKPENELLKKLVDAGKKENES